ncbi:hypothetical protein DFJ58DRAFT_730797 [Suillus subalutaceus]|uniref:uncharacterized protein n=1 Tax=Suillus subalutaceus TaxID=48586 RepID=UPI001B86FF11|nr:uncharacterized protein DFJ58DRAFT_730797 [Suillus subalutaceus]KAG1845735.1 hypothetical protein DFJ58DRAFT_730797 [Suillus subalutaceus]
MSGFEFASRIIIAQRQYSAPTATVVVPASLEKQDGNLTIVTTGVSIEKRNLVRSSSLHSHSVSLEIGQAIGTDYSPSLVSLASTHGRPAMSSMSSFKTTKCMSASGSTSGDWFDIFPFTSVLPRLSSFDTSDFSLRPTFSRCPLADAI